MQVEIFKTINGFDDYSVSNLGNVKHTETGEVLNQYVYEKSNKYAKVSLKRNEKHRLHDIHVLIARAFIPNPENKRCVDHIDREPTNNNVDNLRWVSQQENLMNQNKRRTNTSGYSGVSFYKHSNKWRTQLMAVGKTYSKIF